MVEMKTFKTRDEWLSARGHGTLGGSDVACVLGLNPWKSNVELWLEKSGQATPDDISKKDVVVYGTKAEKPLRDLFKLDYPDMKVEYKANNIWFNDKIPWLHSSLDGWLTDKDGRKGVLEIKTTNIMASRQKELWHDQIPPNYYAQVLSYLAVTESEFAILKALLRWEIEGEVYEQIRHYRIERSDVEEDIEYLLKATKKFVYENIGKRKKPALILPEI